MTRARDVAFIRKLCGLGLPAQTLAQSLLPALRALIPSHSAGVFWVDAQGQMTSLYAERLLPPDAMTAYYERHYQSRGESFAEAFRRRAAASDPVSSHSWTAAEQTSAYFRDVLSRLNAYHAMYGILRDDARRPYAQISFYRGAEDKPFDRAQFDALRSVLRYLAIGLAPTATHATTDHASVVVDEQLGIVLRDGTIVSAPDAWRRLLRLAALSSLSPQNAKEEAAAISEFVRDICATALEPSGRLRGGVRDTAWGRFVFRGFVLDDERGRRASQIGLLVRREEPRSLTLIRGAGVSELSPQQREVALLLAQGRSNREIGEELNLTLNTVSYHVKQVFARLQVNDRAAVMDRLLGIAQSTAAT